MPGPFKLKSGNSPLFKQIGSSPAKQDAAASGMTEGDWSNISESAGMIGGMFGKDEGGGGVTPISVAMIPPGDFKGAR